MILRADWQHCIDRICKARCHSDKYRNTGQAWIKMDAFKCATNVSNEHRIFMQKKVFGCTSTTHGPRWPFVTNKCEGVESLLSDLPSNFKLNQKLWIEFHVCGVYFTMPNGKAIWKTNKRQKNPFDMITGLVTFFGYCRVSNHTPHTQFAHLNHEPNVPHLILRDVILVSSLPCQASM